MSKEQSSTVILADKTQSIRALRICVMTFVVYGLVACGGGHGGSKDGGEAGGGGNTIVPLSSDKEISQAIDDARTAFVQTFTRTSGMHGDLICGATFIAEIPKAVHKPRLIQIMADLSKDCSVAGPGWFALPRLENLVTITKIEKRAQGPCDTQDGAHREAAVTRISDPNSPICFSVELLRRLPKELMQAQVLGLIAHEFTHKFGYGEEDAVLVQKFFISEIANKRAESRKEFYTLLNQAVRDISTALAPGLSKEEICAAAGRAEAHIQTFFGFYYSVRDRGMVPTTKSEGAGRFDLLIFDFVTPNLVTMQCGPAHAAEPRAVLEEVQKEFQEIQALAPEVIPTQY